MLWTGCSTTELLGLSYAVNTFGCMPRIAAFYGIAIFIYSREHGRPHFHARHGDHEAVVAIDSGEILVGGLPRRESKLVAQWWKLHQDELGAAWWRAVGGEAPGRIAPLP